MEMDELQRAWGQLDARLAEQGRQLAQVRRQRGMDGVRTRLRWISLGQLVELGVGLAVVLWAGGYWVEHRAQTHLLIYGLALHAYGLGLLCFAVTQLLWLASIDYQAPVLVVQRKLQRLAQLRAFSGRIMLSAGMLAWVPLVMVGLAAVGLDLWQTRPAVVWANLAVGVGIVLVIEGFHRRYPERCGREHQGGILRRARAELDELSASPAPDQSDVR